MRRPGGFEDVMFVNRLDALFAGFYFAAFDTSAGDVDAVPPAWRIVFSKRRRRSR